MHFPVEIPIFGRQLPPHAVMETAAYVMGFQLYRMLRGRYVRSKMPFEQTAWVFVGCVLGAVAGSKMLAWVESIDQYAPLWRRPEVWLGAKTIVGALLGGWIGVELAKKRVGVDHSTGDVFVFPLILGIAVGRIGCFLSGLADHTYGIATSLPWGVNFGDGVLRHPTQIYEILFLVMFGLILWGWSRRKRSNGSLFKLFMFGYLSWRLFIEFYKPRLELIGPFSAIQSACIVGMAACIVIWRGNRKAARGKPQMGQPQMGQPQMGQPQMGQTTQETPCPTAPISFTN